MISYCIACYRPRYAQALIDELLRKTTVPFEILLWLNVADEEFEAFLREREATNAPIRVIGRTPENIGMAAYFRLFAASRFEMLTQIDDDVVCVSPRVAETAQEIFKRFQQVGMLVADVWQDDYTNGARPPMEHYREFNSEYGLYDGPIDGWFAVYRKEALERVYRYISPRRYFYLGAMIKKMLRRSGTHALLCTRLKVFHVIGPEYASYFGMLDFEIEKYRNLGRMEIVEWYNAARDRLPPAELLHEGVCRIRASLS